MTKHHGEPIVKNLMLSLSLASLVIAATAGIMSLQPEPPMDETAKAALTEKFTQAAVDKQMQEWVRVHNSPIAKDVAEEIARGLHWETKRDYIVLGQIDMEKVRDDVKESWKMAAPPPRESRTAAGVFGAFALITGAAGLYYRSRERKPAGPN